MALLRIARTDEALQLRGEIDLAVADDVRAAVLDALDAGISVVDMADVTFIESTGLRALLAAASTVDGHGTLTLRNPSRSVTKILAIALPNGAPGLTVSP